MHTMRAGAALLVATLAACRPNPDIDWTCDFEASVDRPLANPDAEADEGGAFAPSVCGDTCGPPAKTCTFVILDGGIPGAVCPVCTF